MSGCQNWDQRQVQVANDLASLVDFCVDINLRLINLSRKQAHTGCQPPEFLESARRRMYSSNRVFQPTQDWLLVGPSVVRL
jgi:hypothetical protein